MTGTTAPRIKFEEPSQLAPEILKEITIRINKSNEGRMPPDIDLSDAEKKSLIEYVESLKNH